MTQLYEMNKQKKNLLNNFNTELDKELEKKDEIFKIKNSS